MVIQDKLMSSSVKCTFSLLILCITMYFAVFAVLNIFGFTYFCDPDTYTDTFVSKLIWDQKTLFPDNWTYGNQFYVIATPVLAALFYGLTGSINLGMVLATETMSVLILLSFFWVLRAITNDKLISACSCLLLIASIIAPSGPYSYNAQLFFLQASYYACYLITLFVVYGDYIRAFQTTKTRPVSLLLSMVLSFATGMQSLRQTVIMVLPILACECFLAFRRLVLREPLWNTTIRTSVFRAICYAVANISGYLLIKQINIPHIAIIGGLTPVPLTSIASRLPDIWNAFLRITGLIYVGDPNTSAFFGFFAILQLLICIGAGIIWLMELKQPITSLKLCWLLSLVGIFGVCLSGLFFHIGIRDIYLFLYYTLVTFSGLLLLDKVTSSPKKCVIAVLLCALSLGNLFLSYRPYAEQALQNSPTRPGKAFRLARSYGYLSEAWDNSDFVDSKNMANWLLREGYAYTYSEWIHIPRIAVHSDGQLVAGCWPMQNTMFEIIPYLNPLDIYGPNDNAKAVYIFTPLDESYGLQLAKAQGVSMTKVAEFGQYHAYTSSAPLMHFNTP